MIVDSVDRSSNGDSSTTCISVRLPSNKPQDAVELVGDLVQALEQLLVIDLEDRLERRQLLEQASPLVDAAHALHQEALRRRGDDVLAGDRAELDLERAGVPDQRAIDRLFAAEAAELGVDDLAVAEVDARFRRPSLMCAMPLLRLTSKVCSRSTTPMSSSEPLNRVRRLVGMLVAILSCVRRARSRFTRAISSRTKMGLVR